MATEATQAIGELTVKLTAFPKRVRKLDRGARAFFVDLDGIQVEVFVSKKSWNRFEREQAEHEHWLAVLKAPVRMDRGVLRFARSSRVQLTPREPKPEQESAEAPAEPPTPKTGALPSKPMEPSAMAPASPPAPPVDPSHPRATRKMQVFRDPAVFGTTPE